jgi:CBS domain-containing protein
MDVARLCQRNVATINPFDDLALAAETMRKQHVSYLVVVEPALADGGLRPVGVLTDRDIVIAVVAQEADPRVLRVGGDAQDRRAPAAGGGRPRQAGRCAGAR